MNQRARPLDASNPIKRTAGKMTAIALHSTGVTLGHQQSNTSDSAGIKNSLDKDG